MASLTQDKKWGTRWIQFVDADGKRCSIGLGKATKERAVEIKAKVEALLANVISGQPWSRETAYWISRQDADLYQKLAKVGLVPTRGTNSQETLAAFLDAYIAGRVDVDPKTTSHLLRARHDLVSYFGADRRLDAITPADADDFRSWLASDMRPVINVRTGMPRLDRKTGEPKMDPLGDNTIRRICSRAKQFFRAAVRKRLVVESPFADLEKLTVGAAEKFTVTREMAAQVLEACKDIEWRLVFALARFGGLRCPSELLVLTWGDVDWELGRIFVDSPKTGPRVVPLFPELRPHLQAVYDELLEDFDPKVQRLSEQPVITRYRDTNANLATQLKRIIRRAGLKPWPSLFNSLRSTRETELADKYPLHVVCKWLGNSEKIAAKHYLKVTDEHFAAATGARVVMEHPVFSVPEEVLSGNQSVAETKKAPENRESASFRGFSKLPQTATQRTPHYSR